MKYLVTLTRLQDLHTAAVVEVDGAEGLHDDELLHLARWSVTDDDWEDPILGDHDYVDIAEVQVLS